MNERHFEILKEIIVDFNEYSTDYTKTRCKEIEQVLIDTLDYITNLQQELEEYKDTETYSKRFLYKANKDRLNANLELVKELQDYKSRCEKAIPMLKELNIKLKGILNTGIDIKEISDIEDTLNGRSDE